MGAIAYDLKSDLKEKQEMRKICFMIGFGFLLNSCATLLHDNNVDVRVYSDTDSVKIFVNDDTTAYYPPTVVNVKRSGKDLSITAWKDTVRKTVSINSRLSTAFWLGNLPTAYAGYIIDLTNSKKYTYPSDIKIHFNAYKKSDGWVMPKKYLLIGKFSIPVGQFMFLNKGNEYGHSFGFFGFSEGLEYYFSDKYSLNMDIGMLNGIEAPIPSPQNYHNCYERSDAGYADIQLGCDDGRFHSNVGLQINRTAHRKMGMYDLSPSYRDTLISSKFQNNVGIALSTSYRLSNNFHIGLNYFPSFFSWEKDHAWKARYSHLVFLEIKMKLFRQKENIVKRLYKSMLH